MSKTSKISGLKNSEINTPVNQKNLKIKKQMTQQDIAAFDIRQQKTLLES